MTFSLPVGEENYTYLEGLFPDVATLREEIEKRDFEVSPQLIGSFSQLALSKRVEMRWLSGVRCNLEVPEPDKAREQLDSLFNLLVSKAEVIDYSFCPIFPEGYRKPLIALDTETTGLDTRLLYDSKGERVRPTELVGLCLAVSDSEGWYLPVKHLEEDPNAFPNWPIDLIVEFMGRIHDHFAVVYHNAEYDREIMSMYNVRMQPWPYFFDTMLISNILRMDQKLHGLKRLAPLHLRRNMIEIKDLVPTAKKGKSSFIRLDLLPARMVYVYGCSDAMNTFGLFKHFISEEANPFKRIPVVVSIDHKTVDVLRGMYRPGMPVNYDYCVRAALDVIHRYQTIQSRMDELVGDHVDLAPAKLSYLLFDCLGIPTLEDMERGKPSKAFPLGVYSTDEDTLNRILGEHPEYTILEMIILQRKLQTINSKVFIKLLLNSFVDGVIPYTRAQVQYSQIVIPSGRLSSSSGSSKPKVTIDFKRKKPIARFSSGSWTCGINSQGINSNPLKWVGAKKLKRIPARAGVSIEDPYGPKVWKFFAEEVARI